MVSHVGASEEIINIIKNVYKSIKYCVAINGKVTKGFIVFVGLRQGSLLSPTLLNIFLEFVMKKI